MAWIVTAALIAALIVIVFWWGNSQTRKQHAAFTKNDVVKAIENVLTNDYHDEWDLFLAWPIRDPYLEAVRQECLVVCKEHSGKEKGRDIETTGEARLRLILDELTTRA
jgi:hypothetical protein